MTPRRHKSPSIWDRRIVDPRDWRCLPQAPSADDGEEPGDVRCRDRQRPHDVEAGAGRDRRRQRAGLRAADHVLALAHGDLRQLCRGDGRGPGQGAGGHAAAHPDRDVGEPVHRRATETVPAALLRKDDVVLVTAGEFIPGDGEIIEGVASVDESAITGESAPVIRESEATDRPSPAARASSRTGSRCASRRIRGIPSSTA